MRVNPLICCMAAKSVTSVTLAGMAERKSGARRGKAIGPGRSIPGRADALFTSRAGRDIVAGFPLTISLAA